MEIAGHMVWWKHLSAVNSEHASGKIRNTYPEAEPTLCFDDSPSLSYVSASGHL